MNCMIIDDEPIAQEILEDYLKMVPGARLVATCKNAMEAFTVLRRQQVDVIFVDIQMPEVSGLDFIRSLKNVPEIILTTAYPQYAVEGFELDVADYLLKPVSIDRFLKAINKIFARWENREKEPAQLPHADNKQFFFVKSSNDFIKIELEKILYIESMENYVRIHCEDNIIISFTTMKSIEASLSPHKFLRIHRSYIVNMSKVDAVTNYVFKIKEQEIVVGKSYRKKIAEVLNNFYSIGPP